MSWLPWICIGCSDAEQTPPAVVSISSNLTRAFDASQSPRDVIIGFREPRTSGALRVEREMAIARLQYTLASNAGDGFTQRRRFRHVPALAARISKPFLERLQHDPNVAYVQLDREGGGQLKEAVPAVGGDAVQHVLNLTGLGVRVAVLDTGVDTTHPDLRDAIVAQHCFTQGDCPPLRTHESTSAEDDHGHGSHVVGIIASNGVVSSVGFAPDAEIVAVKVDDQNDSGHESDWVAGLDWVYDNLATLHVQLVNISVCTDALYENAADCDAEAPAMAAAVKNLLDAGVTVFAASGNRGSPNRLSAPACITGVISVGATYDSASGHQPPDGLDYQARWGGRFAACSDSDTAFDQIACFTNSGPRLDLVAPGAPVLSDSLHGDTRTYWGTSQACPAAVGVAALMLQCNPKLEPPEIKDVLLHTGVERIDPKNGLAFPSIRALAAVMAACPWLAAKSGHAAVAGARADLPDGASTDQPVGGGGSARDMSPAASGAQSRQTGSGCSCHVVSARTQVVNLPLMAAGLLACVRGARRARKPRPDEHRTGRPRRRAA
jgi:subtilisin family serine protease